MLVDSGIMVGLSMDSPWIVFMEHGEKFAFGEIVKVCSNFTILNADYVLDTSKRIKKFKHTTDDAIEFFSKGIFDKTEYILEQNIHEIEGLKSKEISSSEFYAFMGQEHQRIEVTNAARKNHTISKIDDDYKKLAVNSTQLSKINIEAANPRVEYAWKNIQPICGTL
jgi:hypothetical protein